MAGMWRAVMSATKWDARSELNTAIDGFDAADGGGGHVALVDGHRLAGDSSRERAEAGLELGHLLLEGVDLVAEPLVGGAGCGVPRRRLVGLGPERRCARGSGRRRRRRWRRANPGFGLRGRRNRGCGGRHQAQQDDSKGKAHVRKYLGEGPTRSARR